MSYKKLRSLYVCKNAGINNTSAIAQFDSTTQGELIPRMTQAQKLAIASPATGLAVIQTDGFFGRYTFNGTSWVLDSLALFDYISEFAKAGVNLASSGNVICIPYVPKFNMIVNKINCNCSSFSGAQTIYMGIYNGALTTSLGYASVSVTSAGKATVTLGSGVALTEGVTYYLVFEDALASGNNFSGQTVSTGNIKALYVGGALGGNLSAATADTRLIYMEVSN